MDSAESILQLSQQLAELPKTELLPLESLQQQHTISSDSQLSPTDLKVNVSSHGDIVDKSKIINFRQTLGEINTSQKLNQQANFKIGKSRSNLPIKKSNANKSQKLKRLGKENLIPVQDASTSKPGTSTLATEDGRGQNPPAYNPQEDPSLANLQKLLDYKDDSSSMDLGNEEDGEGWRTPGRRQLQKRKNSNQNLEENNTKKLVTDNRYNILSNLELDLNILVDNSHILKQVQSQNSEPKSSQIPKNVNDKQSNKAGNNNPQDTQNKTKQVKFLPPIIIKLKDWKPIHTALRRVNTVFKTKPLYNDKVKVCIREDFREVRQGLIADFQKIGYIDAYTYTPKDEKPVVVLLKGVHHTIPIEEIYDEFKLLYPETKIEAITEFETKRSRDNNRRLNTFRIVLAPGSDITQIVKTRYFCNFCVSWEKPRLNGPVRCKRCQQYGHLAVNCLRVPICVKCATSHPQGECKLTETDKPKCNNCGQEGHPSSYRGCPFYKKYIERIRNNRNHNTNTMALKTSGSRVVSGKSYADNFKENFPPINSVNNNRNTNINVPQTNSYDNINLTNLSQANNNFNSLNEFAANANYLFDCSFSDILNDIASFNKRCRLMPVQQARMEYLELISKLVGGHGNK